MSFLKKGIKYRMLPSVIDLGVYLFF